MQPDGTPVQMVQPSDLPPLAQDTTLQATNTVLATLATQATAAALLTALNAMVSPKATQVQIDLSVARADYAVPLGTLTGIARVKVKTIAGAPASLTLKLGATTETPVDLDANSDWQDLNGTALFLNAPATAGGSVTLQIWGH